MIKKVTIILCSMLFFYNMNAQHSIAREWNEKVLDAIRSDFARPTVHARNLFHISAAMYDAWAVYENNADTYFLGKTVQGYNTPLQPFPTPNDIEAAQKEAISFAVYRIMQHRFANAPRILPVFEDIDAFMFELGYNINNEGLDYACSPAAMGNYIAKNIIEYGATDGANEEEDYANLYYESVNPPLLVDFPGNLNFLDLNRWQPLEFGTFIDQSGTNTGDNSPDFLSPEWGNVSPFSLQEEDATNFSRDRFGYKVYHNPGAPPYLDTNTVGGLSEEYKWGNALVAVWSSHLDPADTTMWDISPAALGNMDINSFPTDIPSYRNFYNLIDGGDLSVGYQINPITAQPYESQIVPRGDYARILAEFWADGPDSETPPGHWFTILNYVNDRPELERKFRGEGEELNDLEWDVKAYFILGGTMHDVAISAWGIKGWYDYVRPVSAIRGMAEFGQSSDETLPSYHAGGLPLIPDYIELIKAGDELDGSSGQFIGDVKIKAWKGPRYITNPRTDIAEVGWIRAAQWYPYQRPSFVTPPFAGYISGHSTYSRAAAEVLTLLTGDEFFPGGMGEFFCKKDQFLVFENGPSMDITLQWATYRDAADQCSLSRIWGGIHPPADDIPGRFIGERIGIDAFNYAEAYFEKEQTLPNAGNNLKIYPNPVSCLAVIEYDIEGMIPIQVFHSNGQLAKNIDINFENKQAFLNLEELPSGNYIIIGLNDSGKRIFTEKVVVF